MLFAKNYDDISIPVAFPFFFFFFLKDFLVFVFFFQDVEDFLFMNSLLISKFLLILFI